MIEPKQPNAQKVVRQNLPSIKIAKTPNPEGEEQMTITIARRAFDPVQRSGYQRLSPAAALGGGQAPPQPLVETRFNEQTNAYDVYVTLVNENDEVTIGRPQSEDPSGGGG